MLQFILQTTVAELRLRRRGQSFPLDASLRRKAEHLHLNAGQLRRLHLFRRHLRAAPASLPEETGSLQRVTYPIPTLPNHMVFKYISKK